jgi:hypothetical protein
VPLTLHGSEAGGVTSLVLLKRNDVAAFKRRNSLVHIWLCPRHIVVLFDLMFGNAFINELTRSLLNRGKVTTCDMGLKPRFLFGCKCNRHAFLYHKNPYFNREITARFCICPATGY